MTRHESSPSRLSLPLAQIARELGGELVGDPGLEITGLAPLETAGPTELSFLSNPKYRSQLATTGAGCVIVAPALREEVVGRGQGGTCIVADDPYLYFARVTQLWQRLRTRQYGGAPNIHPSAVIDPSADIDPTAHIGPLCVVERGAKIGAQTVLKSRVTVAEDCIIGARCIIHPGAVIGSDGFGFAPRREGADTHWEKIEQLGRVRIGDGVEIGANTCIDRGALSETVIEDGVKLDNLIQIAHNVHIGRNTAIAAQVGIAGSTRIGANSTLAGQAGVVGHVQLADGVHVSAATSVTRSLPKPGVYTGMYPFDENDAWQKNAAALRQLAALRERVRMLEKEIKLSNKEPEK